LPKRDLWQAGDTEFFRPTQFFRFVTPNSKTGSLFPLNMSGAAVDKYAEAEGVVETVIKIFSERADPNAAREAGRDIADLKRRVTERHTQLVQSIRGAALALARATAARARGRNGR